MPSSAETAAGAWEIDFVICVHVESHSNQSPILRVLAPYKLRLHVMALNLFEMTFTGLAIPEAIPESTKRAALTHLSLHLLHTAPNASKFPHPKSCDYRHRLEFQQAHLFTIASKVSVTITKTHIQKQTQTIEIHIKI